MANREIIRINYQGGGDLNDFVPKEARIEIYTKQAKNDCAVILLDIKELLALKEQINKTLRVMTDMKRTDGVNY